MHHAFRLGDQEYNVELSRTATGYRLHLADRIVDIADVGAIVATRGDTVFVHLDGETYELHYEHPLERLAHQAHGAADDEVRAPMPGSLVSIAVKPGQHVQKGETLLVMESMKMETTLAAPRDGAVAAVNYATAQPFERDAVLLTLEPAK